MATGNVKENSTVLFVHERISERVTDTTDDKDRQFFSPFYNQDYPKATVARDILHFVCFLQMTNDQ